MILAVQTLISIKKILISQQWKSEKTKNLLQQKISTIKKLMKHPKEKSLILNILQLSVYKFLNLSLNLWDQMKAVLKNQDNWRQQRRIQN